MTFSMIPNIAWHCSIAKTKHFINIQIVDFSTFNAKYKFFFLYKSLNDDKCGLKIVCSFCVSDD